MPVPVAPGRWPLLGHTPAMLRRRFQFTASLRAHGDVVKIYLGPLETYFVTTPELTYQVLVTDGPSFGKGIMFDKFRPYIGNGVAMSNGAVHMRQRRLMQPAFHRAQIAGYARTMTRATVNLIESWRPGEVRQMDHDLQALAVTIVAETLFSTGVGQSVVDEARRSIPIVIKQAMIRALSPSFVEKLPLPGNRQFDAATARMRSVTLELIGKRRADDTDHDDLLSMLMLARDEDTGESMTDQEVYDEVMTLFAAGIETTALVLSWLFHELSRHPEVERRLHAELDEVLAGRPVVFDDVSKLTYTRQIATEVLRMYPIWILMRRATAEVYLGDVRISPGTEVTISPHAMHFDPRWYPEPERFDPDRWADDQAKDLPKGAFIPFGGGTRQCIGNSFAMTEIAIVVATIAARWRLIPARGKPVRVKYTSTAYPSRLPMTVVPRVH